MAGVDLNLPLTDVSQGACPDCPATQQGVFGQLTPSGGHPCALQSQVVEPRHPLPGRWAGSYALGMVRRGVLIRQRVDPQGRASAVDALGPGCVLPLGLPGHSTSIPSGYAATRLLVCLCPQEVFERSLARDERTARDLIRLQQQTIERLERITDARSRSNVESRVAALICALADTLSPHRSRSRIPSELQQRDMAALIGVRHETVCRVLGTLESRGALERSAEGLRILDRDQLEAC